MSIILNPAKQEEIKTLRNVMQTFHPCLIYAEVRVGMIFALSTSDSEGERKPAVTHNGYPALATIQNTPVKWRACGSPDALITVDQEIWESMDGIGHSALLDHELTHLQVKDANNTGQVLIAVKDPVDGRLDIKGIPDSDCLGRPKLKMRKHDWQLGGFADVTARWGRDAMEILAIKHHQLESGQLVWDWAVEEHQKNKKKGTAA